MPAILHYDVTDWPLYAKVILAGLQLGTAILLLAGAVSIFRRTRKREPWREVHDEVKRRLGLKG